MLPALACLLRPACRPRWAGRALLAAGLVLGFSGWGGVWNGGGAMQPGSARAAPGDTPSAGEASSLQQLGARLFFDARLSADGSVSCASCHVPEQAFADGRAVAVGVGGRRGTRNTPSLLDVAARPTLFWDGRHHGLADQASDPLLHPLEQGLTDEAQLLRIVSADDDYRRRFERLAAGRPMQVRQIYAALAAFQQGLTAGASAFDRFQYGRQPAALSESARRGLRLFTGPAQCSACHLIGPQAATLTDERFHALGIGLGRLGDRLPRLVRLALGDRERSASSLREAILREPELAELGRFLVTHDPADVGAFRTPSLRNVALTAPYMHDGSVATLEEAVDLEIHYRGQQAGRPLVLTPAEKADLLAFLQALTSDDLSRTAAQARAWARPALTPGGSAP